ncbi:MAG: putative metal-binding motif-containing protein [Kofleriaceae bacterium]|nr:putative metal-binding motif-containing protein [Kofleriaceae bacterium]
MRACWLGLGLALWASACGDPDEGVLLRLVVEDDAVAARSTTALELFLGREPVPGLRGGLVREFDPDPLDGDVLPSALVPADLDGFTIRLRPELAMSTTFTVAVAAEGDLLDAPPLFAVGAVEVTFAPGELRRYDVIMREVVQGLPAPDSGDVHAAVWGARPDSAGLPTHRCLKWQTAADDVRRMVRAGDPDCDSTAPVDGACSDPGQGDPDTRDDEGVPVDGDADGFYPAGYIDEQGRCVACGQGNTRPCDCDDGEPMRRPGQPEKCDGVPDNDCDLATDLSLTDRPVCRASPPSGTCSAASLPEIGLCDDVDDGVFGPSCRPLDNAPGQTVCFDPVACETPLACLPPSDTATLSCRFEGQSAGLGDACATSFTGLVPALAPVMIQPGSTCTAELRHDGSPGWDLQLVDLTMGMPALLGQGPVTRPCDDLGLQVLASGAGPFRPVLVVVIDDADGTHRELVHVIVLERQIDMCDDTSSLTCQPA